ncbi:MAG: hypothetical protein Q9227_008785 [Pyrenula ochraceoflavens]
MDPRRYGVQPKTRPSTSSEIGVPQAKRRKLESSIKNEPDQSAFEPNIEEIDLTNVNDGSALADTLAKQREDAVRAQNSTKTDEDQRKSSLKEYKCPVCMDVPENATVTICGHLFCHKCINDTLRFGEEQHRYDTNKPRGNCPVCRKPLARVEKGKNPTLIPLEMKLVTRSQLKGKGKAKEVDDPGPEQEDQWDNLLNWDQ